MDDVGVEFGLVVAEVLQEDIFLVGEVAVEGLVVSGGLAVGIDVALSEFLGCGDAVREEVEFGGRVARLQDPGVPNAVHLIDCVLGSGLLVC